MDFRPQIRAAEPPADATPPPEADRGVPTAVDAAARHGRVVITVDGHTARTLALGWQLLHQLDPVHAEQRPRWFDDMVAILAAAGVADVENGRGSFIPADFRLLPLPDGGRRA